MRRRYMVFGILLILAIIDFAVAAPVLVQKKSQVINAVHIPENAMATLGKRVDDEEVAKVVDEIFGDSDPKSQELPVTPPWLNPPPLAPADGFTNVEKSLSPITEESSPEPSPSTGSPTEESSDGGWWDEDKNGVVYYPASPEPEYGSDHELTEVHGPQPNPNLRPSQGPDADWIPWANLEYPPPPKRPKLASWKEFSQAQEYQGMQQNTGPSNSGPSDPRLPTGPGYEVVTLPSPNLGPPKELGGEMAQGSPPTLESTDPELRLDHQSLSTDSPSQLVDPNLQAAIYAEKNKGKESRNVPGTARDTGHVVQREFQRAERSLNSGE